MKFILLNLYLVQRSISRKIFHRNSNSLGISFYSYPNYVKMIIMEFCRWHDNCAVMGCAQFCSDIWPYSGVTVKQFLIWITMEKSFVKWAPVPNSVFPELPYSVQVIELPSIYNIRRTYSQNAIVPHPVLQLSLCNILSPGVKSRVRM